MANEFKIKNGYLSEGNSQITGSLNVSAGITGSLFGTSSYAVQALSASYVSTTVASASYALSASYSTTALSASYALTASYVNPLNQNVTVTGSLVTVGDLNFIPGATRYISMSAPATTAAGNSIVMKAGNATTSGTGGSLFFQVGTGAGGPGDGSIEIGNQGASSVWPSINLSGPTTIYSSGPNTGTSLTINGGGQTAMRFDWDNVNLVTTAVSSASRILRFSGASQYQVRGSGTTSATIAFLVQNANASSSLTVKDDTGITIGGSTSTNNLNFATSANNTGQHFINYTFYTSNNYPVRLVATATGANGTGYLEVWATSSNGGTATSANSVFGFGNGSIQQPNNTSNLPLTILSTTISGSSLGQIMSVRTDLPSATDSTLTIRAGNATYLNRAGGNLLFQAGAAAGTGDGTNGYIAFSTSNFTAGSGVTNAVSEVARFSINKNFLLGKTLDVGYKLDVSGSGNFTNGLTVTGSINVTAGITGSLLGTSSYATQALSASYASVAQTLLGSVTSASYALTASYVNTLNQNVLITGSATIASTTSGANENTLTLGPSPAGGSGEGGQLGLNAPGGTYASASMIDNYQNQIRILRGTNAGSDALVTQWNLHTKQMQLPAYTAASSFPGTAAANLAVDSGGNIITVSTTGGSVFPYVGNAVITGSLTVTQPIYVPINGAMYFQGGDDAALYDINIVNTMGIYGVQDVTVGAVKLGSNGPVLYGSGSKLGIGTTNPSSASLTVSGNVWATSFTGSLLGTSSYASQALSASYAAIALSASYAPDTTFPYTGSALITGSLGITGSLNLNGFPSGSVLFTSGLTGTVTSSANLYWDNPNGYLKLNGNASTGRISFYYPRITGYLNGIHWGDTDANPYGYIALDRGTGEFRQFAASSYFPTYYSSGAEAMRISTNRNILIGTTTDLARLQVRGSGATSATTTLRVENSSASPSMVVLDNGYVGINTGSAQYNLDVNGTARVSGNLELPTFSLILKAGISGYAGVGNVLLGNNSNIRSMNPSNNGTINLIKSNASGYIEIGGGNNGGTIINPTAEPLVIGDSTIVNSAICAINSTTKGFLPPRTNLTSNISTPSQGLMT